MTVKPGETIGPVRTGLDRAGYVITGADTRAEAMVLAEQAEQRIVFEYAEA